MGVPPRPTPRKRGRRKPAPDYLSGPDFNSPPKVSVPKPKPRPRPKPAKTGPYTKPKPKPYKIGVTAYSPGPTDNSDVIVSPKHPHGKVVWKGTNKPMSNSDLYTSRNMENQGYSSKNYTGHVKGPSNDQTGALRAADKKPRPIHSHGGGSGGGMFGHLNLPGSDYLQPVGKVTKVVAENLPDFVIGPTFTKALETHSTKPISSSPWGAALDAAAILPVGKVARVAHVAADIGEGVKAGRTADEIIQSAKQTARHGKLPADRVIDVGGKVIRAPAAPQIQVRTAQRILDQNVRRQFTKAAEKGLHPQEALGVKGLKSALKNPAQAAARRRVSRLTERVGFYENKASEARPKALENLKLNDVEKVTLRQIARNTHPNAEIKANDARIVIEREKGNLKNVQALKRDNELLRASRHYLEGEGTKASKMRLRAATDKQTKRLERALEETRGVQHESEQAQIRMGDLTPEQAALRKNKPGELSRAATDYTGHAEHEGGFYYPSRPQQKKALSGGFSGKGASLPYAKRGESKAPYEGILQEQGREDPNIPGVVGRQAVFRQAKELADNRLAELRDVGMDHLPNVTSSKELNDTYRVIRATATPNSSATVHLNELLHDLDRTVDVTPKQAESVGKALEQWRDEMVKTPSQVIDEFGKLPDEYKLVHRALLGALEDPKVFNAKELTNFHRAMMDLSTIAKDMVVYTKIGHAPPRLVSNVLMALPDTGLDFIRGLKSMYWLKKNRPDLLKWVHEMMGGGYYKSVTETTGIPHKAVKGMSKALVGWIEFTADRGPRNAAFLAFALKDSGVKSPGELARYLQELRSAKQGTEAWASRVRVMDHARQAAGEYERVGRDAALGNWLFLYRWLKASTVWTGRFVTKHPLMATGLGVATYKYGYRPDQPLYNRFNLKGHNYTTAVPYSTPAEIGERLIAAGKSKPPPLGEGLADMINPAIAAAYAAAEHRDIETGDTLPGNAQLAAAKGFIRQVPGVNVFTGKGSTKFRIEKFLGGNFLPVTEIKGGSKGGSQASWDEVLKELERRGMSKKAAEAKVKMIQDKIAAAEKRAKAAEARVQKRLHAK